MTVSPGANGSGNAPMSALIPTISPLRVQELRERAVPSRARWRIVSSNRITPLMNSSAPGVVNSMSR